MTQPWWEDAKSLFEAASRLPPEDRAALLAKYCQDDAIRAEVQRLLKNYAELGHFLSTSPNHGCASAGESSAPLKAAGDVLAKRFRVVRFIARGGMGEVYEAEDLELQERVALKMIRPQIAIVYPNCLERFKREVLLAKRVTHSNVCRIFDFFRHSDGATNGPEEDWELAFISMELLRGETLSERLRRGIVNPGEALAIVTQVSSALDAAHAVGVLHRDLKPGNIFLVSADGAKTAARVVVTDFGLALAFNEGFDSSITPITQGEFLGTPAFMSPEQLQSLDLTPASDIYSMGLVMYEMVTGVRPFEDETPMVSAARRLSDPVPSPRSVAPDVDRVWESVILKCLEREPSRRFQLAGEVISALKSDSGAVRYIAKSRRNSIAILPFVNASGDPEMEYLSDGITETIISTLARIPKLRVMAHSTVFRFKGKLDDPRRIGRELGVAMVLVGRVLHRAAMLNIGAELVDVDDGRQVWGERYNREFGDVFEVQENIAREISTKLEIKLTSEEKKRLCKRQTQNADAYQLYLKGRFCWNKRTETDLRSGIQFFTKAVAVDESYALAYSGLADSYTTQSFLCQHIPPRELMPQAHLAAAKALSLDETLAEAHASAGLIDLRYRWDMLGAECRFQRAISLKPGYAIAHQWYGECLAAMTRFDRAVCELQTAKDLDPLNLTVNSVLAGMHYFGRQYSESIEQCRATLQMQPDFWIAHFFGGMSHEASGEPAEAVSSLQHAVEAAGRSPMVLAALGHAYAIAGHKCEAKAILDELRSIAESTFTSPVNFALVALGLGDYDLAFAELNRAVETRAGWLVFLRADPRFDCIRSDHRFAALTRIVFDRPGGQPSVAR